MSQYRVCDKCGASIGKIGWLNIISFHLDINIDLCETCARKLKEWAKT